MMYAGDELRLNISLGPGLSSKNLLLYLIFVGIAINTAVTRNRSFDIPSVLIPFMLLIVYALVSWITAAFIIANPDYDVRATFISLKSSLVDQYFTLLIFLFGVIRREEAMWLLGAILWITVLGNVITLIDTFNVPNLGILQNPGRKAGRFDGFVGQPNSYGQILVLFLAPTVALYMSRKGKARTFAAIGVVAAVMALVLSGSRGSWVGLLLGAAFSAFFLRRYLSAQVILKAVSIFVIVCAAIVVVTFATGYSDIYLSSFEKFEGGANRATSGRATIWKTAILAMFDMPHSFVTGHGFDAYGHSREFRMAAHNVYLRYLYDLGAIGVVLFVAVFARILVVARSALANADEVTRRYMISLTFGLSAFLVSIFFSEYHNSAYLLWAFLGVAMRLAVIASSDTGAQLAEATDQTRDNERGPRPERYGTSRAVPGRVRLE